MARGMIRIFPALFFIMTSASWANGLPGESSAMNSAITEIPTYKTTVSNERRVALTFDDVPWVMNRNEPPSHLATYHERMIKALRQSEVPAVGFVNDGKLYQNDTLRPERLRMLEDWLDAGLELGNHTAWHGDLHQIGLRAYKDDIVLGERHIKPLLKTRGMALRWFRHPFLRTGRSLEDKSEITGFLTSHGYRTAPVTINSSEWIYALAYRNAIANGSDPAILASLRNEYIVYMLLKLHFYEARSGELLGYRVPQILNIHANELNADTLPELVAAIRERGYRFTTLDEAVSDPAYQRPDGYTGELGPSWIHRWAKAENRPESFYFGEPETARWVMKLAGVEPDAE